ncbi:hypothetical protein CK203_097964 [Vitis vinifera]|uniref:Uncharacterized protein n=1 Tax=Vitis vinifera TaxID=29760 RepID=A0A438CXZ1_VITVI|nr:hypothetical protein CK203_097964 [Vitis vinifera]
MTPKKTVSSARVSEAGEKAIDKLDVKEFRERFCIPNGVSIDLVNEETAMLLRECVRAPALLQVVTELPDSNKGRGEGAGGGPGWMGGAIGACVEALFSKLYLKNSRSRIEGPPCGLGGKGVLRLKLPKDEVVPGEHYTVKELPSIRKLKRLMLKDGESSWRIEIREKMKALSGRLPDRSGVRTLLQRKLQQKEEAGEEKWEGCEGTTPPKEFPPPQITYEGEVMIEEQVTLLRTLSQAAPDASRAGAESQSQPSDGPDRLAIIPVKGPPSKKPRSTRNLRSGLLGRLEERQQEIEVSCASAHDAHPDGGECGGPESGTRVTSVSSSEEEPADDAAPASPFSYAELEAKLKQITTGWTGHQAIC